MAGGGNGLQCRASPATLQRADAAPGLAFGLIQAVQAMAGRHTGLAPGTLVEVDLEAVLLSRGWTMRREQIAVPTNPRFARLVQLREALDRGHAPLLGDVLVEQRKPDDRSLVCGLHATFFSNSRSWCATVTRRLGAFRCAREELA